MMALDGRFRKCLLFCVFLVVACLLIWTSYGEKLDGHLRSAVKLFERNKFRDPPHKVASKGWSTVTPVLGTTVSSSTAGSTTSTSTQSTVVVTTVKSRSSETTTRTLTTTVKVDTPVENTETTVKGSTATDNLQTTETPKLTTPELKLMSTVINTYDVTTTPKPAEVPEAFRPLMEAKHKRQMLSLLKILDADATSSKIPYFLIAGSALGAYRHEGFVPWDDDLDIAVKKSERQRLFDLLDKHANHSTWRTSGDFQWKFWSHDGNKLRTAWRWPFLDVFFYKENRTHIWVNEMGELTYCHKKDVFPVKRVKFETWLAPVPRKLTKFCQQYFHTTDFSECTSNGYLHSKEMPNEYRLYRTVPCKTLKQFYYFADRTKKPEI